MIRRKQKDSNSMSVVLWDLYRSRRLLKMWFSDILMFPFHILLNYISSIAFNLGKAIQWLSFHALSYKWKHSWGIESILFSNCVEESSHIFSRDSTKKAKRLIITVTVLDKTTNSLETDLLTTELHYCIFAPLRQCQMSKVSKLVIPHPLHIP